MGRVDPSAESGDLQRLRRRLYAPDATAADQARFAAELARSRRVPPGAAQEDAPGEAARGGSGAATPAPSRSRSTLLTASVVALVAGLVLGASVTLAVTRTTAAQPAPSPSVSAARPLAAPRPLAGVALGTSADRRADQQALARALQLPAGAARTRAVQTVGAPSSRQRQSDEDWMERTGCFEWTGSRTFSRSGLRSDLQGGAQATGPAGSHFRVKIFMAKPSGWSWVASGRTDDGTSTGVVALGAGSSAVGSSQIVEFDTSTPTTITSVDIRASPTTPFVWEIDSCLPT